MLPETQMFRHQFRWLQPHVLVALWLSIEQLSNHIYQRIFYFTRWQDQCYYRGHAILLNRLFWYIQYFILIRNNMTNTTKVILIHTHLLKTNTTQSHKHSKDKRCMFIIYAIKLYKTDLGTSPLYFGLSRRVNGERRWSLEYLVVTYAGFYFWNVGTQRTTH